MKQFHFAFAGLALAVVFTACGSNDNAGTTTTTTTDNTSTMADTTAGTGSMTDNTSSMSSTAKTPLTASDSMFVMKAATGGMMEVESGKVAQSNAQNDRVKNFGTMMVNDHGAANQELMAFAQGRGITIPATLPADKQQHVQAMQKMKGKEFDNHYVGMMVSDHKKDIADFEKASKSADDADLKAWATKTLPTLRMHLDSAQALSKARL